MATKSATVAKQPVITMTLKGIIEQLAEGQDLPKKQANALLAGMIDRVKRHLISRVATGSGSAVSGYRRFANARPGWAVIRRSAKPFQIAASKKVAFRPAKELKDAV
jgi:DNA-binding protein HU-beta